MADRSNADELLHHVRTHLRLLKETFLGFIDFAKLVMEGLRTKLQDVQDVFLSSGTQEDFHVCCRIMFKLSQVFFWTKSVVTKTMPLYNKLFQVVEECGMPVWGPLMGECVQMRRFLDGFCGLICDVVNSGDTETEILEVILVLYPVPNYFHQPHEFLPQLNAIEADITVRMEYDTTEYIHAATLNLLERMVEHARTRSSREVVIAKERQLEAAKGFPRFPAEWEKDPLYSFTEGFQRALDLYNSRGDLSPVA